MFPKQSLNVSNEETCQPAMVPTSWWPQGGHDCQAAPALHRWRACTVWGPACVGGPAGGRWRAWSCFLCPDRMEVRLDRRMVTMQTQNIEMNLLCWVRSTWKRGCTSSEWPWGRSPEPVSNCSQINKTFGPFGKAIAGSAVRGNSYLESKVNIVSFSVVWAA